MTDTANDAALTGEARLSGRKKKFWRFVSIMFCIAAASGAIWGFIESDGDMQARLRQTPAIAWAFVGAVVIAMVWFSAEFFRRVDELEIADNLWASLIGFYAYVILFPAWWALAQVDAAPPIHPWALYWTTAAVATIVYLARKFRVR